jgi:hypothetical protein
MPKGVDGTATVIPHLVLRKPHVGCIGESNDWGGGYLVKITKGADKRVYFA